MNWDCVKTGILLIACYCTKGTTVQTLRYCIYFVLVNSFHSPSAEWEETAAAHRGEYFRAHLQQRNVFAGTSGYSVQKHTHPHNCVQTCSGMRTAAQKHRVYMDGDSLPKVCIGTDGAGGCDCLLGGFWLNATLNAMESGGWVRSWNAWMVTQPWFWLLCGCICACMCVGFFFH